MKITTFFIAVFFGLMSFQTMAQSYTLKGNVVDSDNEAIPGVSVFLLDDSDSTFLQFVSTDPNGIYQIKTVKEGTYLIQTSFVGFKSKYTPISVKGEDKIITVNPIKIEQDSQLDEVTIQEEIIPIQMRGDTLEYNAGAFKTRENDVAEDLIKQLPGVDVDQDGNIKTQGENVNKVLVNGKEFFGDDPKLATKNIPAESIKKVQVFDQQSDQSELSGIDDGETTKTINIELKDDRNKGYFGRVTGGWGYNDDDVDTKITGGEFDRYEFDANLNRFSDKMQLAFLGQVNNTNKQGFSFQDYLGFIGGYENFETESGGNRWNFNSSDLSVPLSGSGNSGLSESLAAGLNFNYDFNKKTKLISSYFYSLYNNNLEQTSFTENFIEGGSYKSLSNGSRETTFGSHKVNLRFDHKFDSTQNIRIRGGVKKNDGDIYSKTFGETRNLSDSIQNNSISNVSSKSNDFSFNANVLHSKRLKKKGRVITTNITGSNSTSEGPLFLTSQTNFFNYNPYSVLTLPLTQEQNQTENTLNYKAKVTYTEPLGKKRYLELNASYQNNNYESIREFFDVLPTDKIRNTILSNNYNNSYTYTKGGLSFKKIRKKYNLTLGADGQYTELKGQIVTQDTSINKTFVDVLPRFNLRYNFSSSKRFMLRYNTSINAPSLNQLQPVQNNTNPTNLYVGNSELERAYNHTLYMHYMSFSQFSGRNFFANIYTQFTQDKITNATTVDPLTLVRTTQPINVDYDVNTNSYLSFGAPLKFMKSKFNISTNNGYGKGIVYVNGSENISNRLSNGLDFSIENTKKDIIDILVGVEFNRTNTQYSVNSNFNQTFFTTTYFADLTLDLKQWSINTTFDYNNYSGKAFETNQIIPIFNAYLSRMMLKSKRMELRLSVYDILNKNQGFDRSFNLNYLQEQTTNNLSRYVMFSLFYKLGQNQDEGKGMSFGGRRKK